MPFVPLSHGIHLVRDSPVKRPVAVRRNISALTGLRFFAAFAVVVYHFARPALAGWPWFAQNLAASGYVAVDFFFLLSGFVLCYSYLQSDGSMAGTSRGFYVARFARIYPAYLLAFVLAAPTNIAWSLHVNRASAAVFKLTSGGAAVLTLQQAWTPWTAWAWNFPAWSISVEAFFYLLFPLAAPLMARLRYRASLAALGVAWLAALIPPFLLFLLRGTHDAPQLSDHLQMAVEFTPLLRLPEFLAGILLGRLFVCGSGLRKSTRLLFVYGSAAAIFAVLAFSSTIPHPLLSNGLLLPLFALLIYGLADGKSALQRFLSLPGLVLLGEASYGLYILQIPVSYLLRMPPPHHSLAQFGAYSAILVSGSLLSWKFVETPARNYLRTRLAPKADVSDATKAAPGLVKVKLSSGL